MQVGMEKSETQVSNSLILISRSLYHVAKLLIEGYARLVQLSGMLSKKREFSKLSMSAVMVSSP